MECYNCRETVDEEEARTISQVIIVCPKCYRKLSSLIFHGYFDVPTLEDGLIEEAEIQTHLSVLA